jgi:hypothetical protein
VASFLDAKSDTDDVEYTDSRVGSWNPGWTGWKRIPSEKNGSDSGVANMDRRDRVLSLAVSDGVCGSIGSSIDCTVDDTDLAGGRLVYLIVWLLIPAAFRVEVGSGITSGWCFLDLKPIAFVSVLNFMLGRLLELFWVESVCEG